MNREMDLRSAEFIASRRFFKPGLFKILSAGLIIAALAGIHCGGNAYVALLRSDLLQEEAVLRKLKDEAFPLLVRAEETALLKDKSSLKKEIASSAMPLSQYLQSIRKKAAGSRIKIESILVDHSGNLAVTGTSGDLDQIALYSRALLDLKFIVNTAVSSIDMDRDKGYRFKIEGVVNAESGAAGDD